MENEPIEGRILEDDEKIPFVEYNKIEDKLKGIYNENLSSLQESLNESRRQSYQQSRAENFYKQFDKQVIDRNNIWDTLRRGL